MSAITQETEIGNLSIDTDLQPRVDGLDPSHIAQLQEVIDDVPPIKVVKRGDVLFCVDGFHRLAALQNLGRGTAMVEIVDAPLDGDLRGLAFALNAAHGRPLFLNDRRAEATRILYFSPTTSDREVGRHCGLSQPTVAKIRMGMEQSAKIERTSSRVGKGGYRYEVGQPKASGDARNLEKAFDRFLDHITGAVDSDWWDAADIVQMLLDVYEETVYPEILETLRGFATQLDTLAQVFQSAME